MTQSNDSRDSVLPRLRASQCLNLGKTDISVRAASKMLRADCSHLVRTASDSSPLKSSRRVGSDFLNDIDWCPKLTFANSIIVRQKDSLRSDTAREPI